MHNYLSFPERQRLLQFATFLKQKLFVINVC